MNEMSKCVHIANQNIDKDGYPTAPSHRQVYEAFQGYTVPPQYVVHHMCKDRACVNPTHLIPMARNAHSKLHNPGNVKLEPAYEPAFRAEARYSYTMAPTRVYYGKYQGLPPKIDHI